MKKPINWSELAFYEKIRYYGTQLDATYAKYVDKLEAKAIAKAICGDAIEIPKVIRIQKTYTRMI